MDFLFIKQFDVVNGDESSEHLKFIENFNNKIDKPWVPEIQPINISFSNPEDSENSNIELESVGGYSYTIYTETNDLLPPEMVEKMKVILSKKLNLKL